MDPFKYFKAFAAFAVVFNLAILGGIVWLIYVLLKHFGVI